MSDEPSYIRRNSLRASFIDYDAGNYFVTICCHKHFPYLGRINGHVMHYTRVGAYLIQQFEACQHLSPYVEVPFYVVNTNHIHFIACLHPSPDDEDITMRQPGNAQGLSTYVNQLKGTVTRYANREGLPMRWQRGFYDHCIRGIDAGNAIDAYIRRNIASWDAVVMPDV